MDLKTVVGAEMAHGPAPGGQLAPHSYRVTSDQRFQNWKVAKPSATMNWSICSRSSTAFTTPKYSWLNSGTYHNSTKSSSRPYQPKERISVAVSRDRYGSIAP